MIGEHCGTSCYGNAFSFCKFIEMYGHQIGATMKHPRTERAYSALGGARRSATDFWDRIITIDELAALLQVRVSEIRTAVLQKQPLNGIEMPEIHSITPTGAIYFVGKSVQKAVEQRNQSARDRKRTIGW